MRHRPRWSGAFAAALALIGLAALLGVEPALAQAPGPQDTLRIAQIEQVTNFDPALMSTQDMGVLIVSGVQAMR